MPFNPPRKSTPCGLSIDVGILWEGNPSRCKFVVPRASATPRTRFQKLGWESDHWKDVPGGMCTCVQLTSLLGTMENFATSVAVWRWKRTCVTGMQGTVPPSITLWQITSALGQGNECQLPQPKLSYFVGLDYTHSLNGQTGLSKGDKPLQVSAIEYLVCGHSSGVFTTFNS